MITSIDLDNNFFLRRAPEIFQIIVLCYLIIIKQIIVQVESIDLWGAPFSSHLSPRSSPFFLNLRTIRLKERICIIPEESPPEQHGHGPSSETRGECCEEWEWFFLAGEKPRLSEGFIHVLSVRRLSDPKEWENFSFSSL